MLFSSSIVIMIMMIITSTEDENGHKPEALNKKAVAIVNRVRDKLTGTSYFPQRHIISTVM